MWGCQAFLSNHLIREEESHRCFLSALLSAGKSCRARTTMSWVFNTEIRFIVYPEIMYKAFQPSDYQLTSIYVQDLFKPLFSPKGSNNRESEEAIVMSWILYLQNIKGMYNNFIVCTLTNYKYYHMYFMC